VKVGFEKGARWRGQAQGLEAERRSDQQLE
jgi:hypothetical protein